MWSIGPFDNTNNNVLSPWSAANFREGTEEWASRTGKLFASLQTSILRRRNPFINYLLIEFKKLRQSFNEYLAQTEIEAFESGECGSSLSEWPQTWVIIRQQAPALHRSVKFSPNRTRSKFSSVLPIQSYCSVLSLEMCLLFAWFF